MNNLKFIVLKYESEYFRGFYNQEPEFTEYVEEAMKFFDKNEVGKYLSSLSKSQLSSILSMKLKVVEITRVKK